MPALPPGQETPPSSAASAPSKPAPPVPAAASPKPAAPPVPAAAPPKPAAPPVPVAPPTVAPPTVASPPRAAAAEPTPQAQAAEKVRSTYRRLSDAAVDLNSASNELAKPVQIWESALKKLNLGVPAWFEISSGGDQVDRWWDRSVGYTKLKDRWGIALRTRDGYHFHPGARPDEELWAFNEAPRWMRIESVGKLPELLDALLKQAEETTQKLRAKIEQANELADAISRVADDQAALTNGK